MPSFWPRDCLGHLLLAVDRACLAFFGSVRLAALLRSAFLCNACYCLPLEGCSHRNDGVEEPAVIVSLFAEAIFSFDDVRTDFALGTPLVYPAFGWRRTSA